MADSGSSIWDKYKGIEGAGFGLGSGIAGMFGGGKNPADQANQTLGQIPGKINGYYQPFFDAGKSELPGYQDMMNKLMSDPGGFINSLGKGYQQSPGYQWNLGQGESAINNANAAGGMLGTPQHQQQAGQLASNLANQDYNQWMQNAMSAFGTGTKGAGDIVSGGQKAGGSLADAIAQVLGQQAQYQYAGQAGQNAGQSQSAGNILGGAAGLAAHFGFI